MAGGAGPAVHAHLQHPGAGGPALAGAHLPHRGGRPPRRGAGRQVAHRRLERRPLAHQQRDRGQVRSRSDIRLQGNLIICRSVGIYKGHNHIELRSIWSIHPTYSQPKWVYPALQSRMTLRPLLRAPLIVVLSVLWRSLPYILAFTLLPSGDETKTPCLAMIA